MSWLLCRVPVPKALGPPGSPAFSTDKAHAPSEGRGRVAGWRCRSSPSLWQLGEELFLQRPGITFILTENSAVCFLSSHVSRKSSGQREREENLTFKSDAFTRFPLPRDSPWGLLKMASSRTFHRKIRFVQSSVGLHMSHKGRRATLSSVSCVRGCWGPPPAGASLRLWEADGLVGGPLTS